MGRGGPVVSLNPTHDPDHGLNSDARVTAFVARQKEWAATMAAARDILLAQGLTETIKWGQPCYTEGGNIAILGGFKTGLRLAFFKGALLEDPLLLSPGENSRAGRYLNFLTAADVETAAPRIRQLIAQARRLEAEGARIDPAEAPDWPEELAHICDEDPDFAEAFRALTPGRQRYWIIHFSEAKQVKTRLTRITKSRDRVMAGRGVND
jgi:uncharacterized protein YdeI (YjbR/CyaY-like superfamily)